MKIMIQQIKIISLLLLITGMMAGLQSLTAQDNLPREYINPDEVISFDRQTSFEDAIEVINQFSQEFEDRFVINRTGYTGSIGLTLPPMHWRDALNYIMRVQNMVIYEEPDLYEILTSEQARQREAPEEVDRAVAPAVERRATTSTREVRINATFFEGSRRALREVGVDWSTLTSGAPGNLAGYITEQGSERIPTQFDNRFVSVNATGAQNVSQSVFNSLINFGEIGAGIEVQALFSAFEADNLGEVLATPSVKVMDGEQGRIQVGEDFSIKQRDFAGNVTDQFFSTGTILTVTPQIIDYNDTTFIYLDLAVERSSAQPDPVSTVISKEEASTHSLLLNGESTVIAGLYRTDRSEVRRGIPILKDLPKWFFGLRYLFGFNSTDVSQSELIVLIQAELEESIPARMAKQFQSKRDLLESQQARHRNELDFVSTEEFGSSFFEQPEAEEQFADELPRTPGEDPETVAQPQSENPEEETESEENAGNSQNNTQQPAIEEQPDPENREEDQEIEVEEKELSDAEREAKMREQEKDLQKYNGEYRTVEMENIDQNHTNLLFYTIGGSFKNRNYADRLFNRMKDQGYNPHMLFNSDSGFYFVAYDGFENLQEAIEYTRNIQDQIQNEAWLTSIMSSERLNLNN